MDGRSIVSLFAFVSAVHAACDRDTTALTSSCNGNCFSKRPCIAYKTSDESSSGNSTSCTAGEFSVCVKDDDGCLYECLKTGKNDFVQNNVVDYTRFTFLIPFGDWKSKWEASWGSDEAASATSHLTDDWTSKFPSKGNDILKAIEPLSFTQATRQLVIAGGTSDQGVRGKVVAIDLSPAFLNDQTELTSVKLVNLELKQIPQSTFPPSVQNLTLSNCLLNAFPDDIPSMSSLYHLDLSQNYLKTYPSKFASSSLVSLNMSGNDIADDAFNGQFPNLTSLDLSSNELTAIPSSVFDMSNLQSLDLSDNSFSSIALTSDQFQFLSSLSTLSFGSFQGTDTCDSGEEQTLASTSVCVGAASDTSDSNSNLGPILGGVLGGVGVVVIALLLYCVCRRKRSTKSKTLTLNAMSTAQGNSTVDRGTVSLWSDQELLSMQLNVDDLEDIRRLGAGALCVVMLARYRRKQLVACKRLKRDEVTWANTQNFVTEIKLMHSLDHPRIVSFIGAAWTIESDLQAVMEFTENGDLRNYLEAKDPREGWTHEKLQLAIDTVEALVYVHSFPQPIVHRDLKSRNVLLDGDFRAKLSDFGIARTASDMATMTTGVGTGRWLAPEVISGQKDYSQSADIWSFGVVLSELDTHQVPYDDIKGPNGNRLADVALLQMVAMGNIRPTFTPSCPEDIRQVANKCLMLDPNDRPTAVAVVYSLRTLQKSVKIKERNTL